MDSKETMEKLGELIRQAEQDPFWAEEFRKMDQWKQAIRDQHGRGPTAEEYDWYYATQNPFQDEE